jgi:hypothetical protein
VEAIQPLSAKGSMLLTVHTPGNVFIFRLLLV